MQKSQKGSVSGALGWKLLERFGVQGIQFVLQIILARLLDPEHYGILSLMVIFTNLANIFIQTGFNTALVQNKDVTEEDYSSVFCVSTLVAIFLYGVIFFAAPLIAVYYKMPDIIAPLRVLALMLIPGAMNSVQLAKVSRELNFRKVFTSNIAAIVISGAVGIALALMGGGLWALVVQTMLNVVIASAVMLFTVNWKPRLICNWKRIKVLFAFGWKLLVSGLLDTLFQDIHSLVVGKKYNSETLAYYNRGKQFPQFIVSAVNSAVQTVMLPVMSTEQDDVLKVKNIARTSITISSYIMFPVMAGLAGVATPLIELLLTGKWLPCVPYLQIYCFSLAFYPVHACNLQAINAMGRSDIFLKLEVIKKVLSLGLLLIGVFCFDSPIAIALTGACSTFTSCFINAYPNKKLIGYSYLEQMKDMLPCVFAAILMLICVLLVGTLNLPIFVLLVLQVLVGVVTYGLVSVLLQLKPFKMLLKIYKLQKS